MPLTTKIPASSKPGSLPVQNGFSLISNEKLIALYANLVKSRMLEESARILLQANSVDSCNHGALGHEASVVGVAIDLSTKDTVAPSHLECTASLLHGVPLSQILNRVEGRHAKARSLSLKRILAQAESNRKKKNSKIVVAFAAEDASTEDSWHEAMHAARNRKLPMIFVSHLHHPGKFESAAVHAEVEDVALKTREFHFPVIPVDGNDVVAVYRVASESITHARQLHSATLIECHLWDGDDPILKMQQYLKRKGLYSLKLKREIANTFARELDAALKIAQAKRA
jgi:TPP-dependent pyruvate/acetoin dehydrogenase alpha subunit